MILKCFRFWKTYQQGRYFSVNIIWCISTCFLEINIWYDCIYFSKLPHFNRLEHKDVKYIFFTHYKRVQLTYNQYVSYALLSLAGNRHLTPLCSKHSIYLFYCSSNHPNKCNYRKSWLNLNPNRTPIITTMYLSINEQTVLTH